MLEQTDQVAASWRTRYDGLRLNTTGWMSTQPGFRATRRRYGEFPSREAWIQYLEDYAEHHRIDVRFGIHARRAVTADGGWEVQTDREDMRARLVVVATGFDHDPDLPDWPGREGFTGELIHSSTTETPSLTATATYLSLGRARPVPRSPLTSSTGGGAGACGLPDAPEPDGPQDPGVFDQHLRDRAQPPSGGRRGSPVMAVTAHHLRQPRSVRASALTSGLATNMRLANRRRPTPKRSCPS